MFIEENTYVFVDIFTEDTPTANHGANVVSVAIGQLLDQQPARCFSVPKFLDGSQ